MEEGTGIYGRPSKIQSQLCCLPQLNLQVCFFIESLACSGGQMLAYYAQSPGPHMPDVVLTYL